ncbi:nitroreductase/quinone reductase family protein [Haloarchaeobius amylolyticus]|uniref:nitroreductase/quinone reductase family protein n=1 Tax=Haloarchaeobius amylolyticus TaxID=1198296 RepID=UPI00226DC152|nr:nitroreductase/quinone reductase family protein [Haloarchaeobius amylolyticus]
MSEPDSQQSTGRIETRGPPLPKPVFEYLVNPLLKLLLRSPLHGLLSDTLLLLTFTGRKSGTQYTTPVAYEELNGDLYVTSQTDRVWWKNLRGGAPVTVRLRGERRDATATVIEDDEAVAEYVRGFIDRHGLDKVSRLAIAIEGERVPSVEELAAGLGDTVVVRIELEEER